MKTKLLIVTMLLTLVGCKDDIEYRSQLENQTSSAEITNLPNRAFTFMVREQDGSIWYYTGNGFSDQLRKVRVFGPPSKEPI